jgi:hypothetical protein
VLSCTRTIDSSTNIVTIKVTSAFGSTIASTDSAGFYITNIKNPISTAQVTGITMQIVDTASDSYLISTKSGITMQVTTPKTASSFSIAFSSPTTVEVYGTTNDAMILSITPGVYINSGCRAAVVFPTDITWQSTLFVTGVVSDMTYTSGTLTLASTTDGQCLASTTETNELVIYVTVIGPPQVKETGSFTFTLTTSSGDSIATGTTTIPSSSITSGTISSFVFSYVSGASTVIQTTTEWKIGFTLDHQLTNPWKILVTYPNSEFTITSCTPSNGIGITTASTT